MKIKYFLASCFGGMLLSAAPAWSFQLEPISQTFTAQGRQSTRSYKVSNSHNKPIAVEISVMKREVNEFGEESLSPADDNFIVYPTQMLMSPLETQTVRVTWVGEADPEAELSYRLIAEQLPIELNLNTAPLSSSQESTASVEVMMRYSGSLYVQPANATPNVVLAAAGLEVDEDGAPWLTIHIKNQGTAREIFEDPQLSLTGGGKTVILKNEALGAIHSRTILAGGERRFQVPWPEELPQGDVVGTFVVK